MTGKGKFAIKAGQADAKPVIQAVDCHQKKEAGQKALQCRKPHIAAVDTLALKQQAFWDAWNEHRDYLRRLSMMWMNVSSMDAEDALSVATLRAFEKYVEHVGLINNERAWFARLLHNICIDLHRANSRRFRLNEKIKEVVEIDNSPSENVDLTPEEDLLNNELGAVIYEAINKLPPKLKSPLIMRLMDGDDYGDIADRLGISNDNARKRVQQARTILRRNLANLRKDP